MSARQDEPKETAGEKKTEPGMAGAMDKCKCMSDADLTDCCGPNMRQMMAACCEPKDKPAPAEAEA